MAVLSVGSGKPYSTIAAAVAAAKDGDTINVDAGTYTNDYVSISKNITLQGVGGMVKLVSTGYIPNGKGIFITNGNITINNFEFSGAKVLDANGAGIRYETGNLTLNNCYFHDNENGLLGGNRSTDRLTINDSEFAYNGYGDGQTHNLYVGKITDLTIDNSYFHDAKVGHEVKSRALNTTITNSRILDLAGTASYSIDLPNGGNATIRNNVIQQGLYSQNTSIIAYGEERTLNGLNPGTNFVISGNTIVNDNLSSSSLAVANRGTASAQITNNRFFGLARSQIASGPNTQTGNQFLETEPSLDMKHPWSRAGLSIGLVADTGWSATDRITTDPAVKGVGQANTAVTIKEGSTTLGTTTADGTGAWTFDPTGLADGRHTLTASQTSATGDTETAVLIFTFYDNPTPQTGTAGNDTLSGTSSGLNIIYGLAGNDIISVQNSNANTELYGGDGNDTIGGSVFGANYIDGGPGNDLLQTYWGSAAILGGDGNDRITAGAGNDTLYGGNGNDSIQGGNGDDKIYGGPGNNRIDGNAGYDTAVFTGNYADYTRSVASGVTTVTGVEGTSTLTNIEAIQFQDGTYDVLAGRFRPSAAAPTVSIALASDTGSSSTDAITSNPAVEGTGQANTTVTIAEGGTTLGTTTTDGTGSWSFAPPGLGDGAHTFVARQTDPAGNTATATLTFTLDTQPPTVSIALASDTGASGTDRITSNPAVKGTGQANTTVTITEGGTTLGTTTAGNTGSWSFTPTGLDNGTHTLVARQTDPAGNTGTATLTFTLDGNVASAPLAGTDGNDVLTGTLPGLNVIYGLGGNDTISVQSGTATTEIYGGDGNDTIRGSAYGANYIDAGSGNDYIQAYWGDYATILGGDGNDHIDAGAGNDSIYGGNGDDTIYGGSGNDTIYDEFGVNRIDGGGGNDTAVFAGNYADYSLTSAAGVVTVAGNAGTATLTNIETIQFQDGSYDVLAGSFLG